MLVLETSGNHRQRTTGSEKSCILDALIGLQAGSVSDQSGLVARESEEAEAVPFRIL